MVTLLGIEPGDPNGSFTVRGRVATDHGVADTEETVSTAEGMNDPTSGFARAVRKAYRNHG